MFYPDWYPCFYWLKPCFHPIPIIGCPGKETAGCQGPSNLSRVDIWNPFRRRGTVAWGSRLYILSTLYIIYRYTFACRQQRELPSAPASYIRIMYVWMFFWFLEVKNIIYIWANYRNSLTWKKAILGWFPLVNHDSCEVYICFSAHIVNLYIYIYLSGWWFGTCLFFPYWECHNPNWRTHIFQRGRYTTNQHYEWISTYINHISNCRIVWILFNHHLPPFTIVFTIYRFFSHHLPSIFHSIYHSIYHLPPLPSGNLTVCYWKLPFIVDLPIKNGDFP